MSPATVPVANAASFYPAAPRAPRWLLWWFFGAVLVFAMVIVGIGSFFRLSKDARLLRDSFIESTQLAAMPWTRRLEFNVGTVTCHLVRAGLSFAPLNAEAKAAVQALRGAEVGVYRWQAELRNVSPSTALSAADEAMRRRGWDRLVRVVKDGEVVLIYVERSAPDSARLRTCVAVLGRDQLVVVSARSNLEPLMELAFNRPKWAEHLRAPL